MRFGTKVSTVGAMLWFHDEKGIALFGILSGGLSDLETAKKDEPLELPVFQPQTGWGSLTLTGDELVSFLDLVPLARRALHGAA